jgi:dihydrofolate synthase/folylpolyglutamate synthase
MRYPPAVEKRVTTVARGAGAPVAAASGSWMFAVEPDRLIYKDAADRIETPLPTLVGAHQPENLALAIAMLRRQNQLSIPPEAYAVAATDAHWPARMQRLAPGPLTDLLAPGSALWLDGGHNPAAGAAIARSLDASEAGPIHLILGMLANKDAAGLLAPIASRIVSLTAVPVPEHEHHAPADLAASAVALDIKATGTAPDVRAALSEIAARNAGPVTALVLGSLYLAGTVLDANGQLPE